MDDGIDDTPFSDSNGQNTCNHGKNSCVDSPYDFNDMVENYMDYSNPSCQNIFTKGQIELMHAVLVNQRVELPISTIDSTVAINTNENYYLSVYPQPAKDLLHIELGNIKGQSKLQLIHISGQLIWEKDIDSNYNNSIHLSTNNYPQGIYLLKYQSDSFRVQTKKVILN